jgi:hypothetical protein
MIPFLGPPHDIHLASAIRTGLIIAWWLMPIAFLLCGIYFARRRDRRGQKLLAGYAATLCAGLFLSSLAAWLTGTYAPHGQSGFTNTLLSTGKCLFTPDTFCAWPELQLLIVPVIYGLLLLLVTSRRRSGR